MKRWEKRKYHSLSVKLVAGILVIAVLILAMWTYNNFYAIQIVRKQAYDSHKNTIVLFMNQIDQMLNDIDRNLVLMGMNDENLQELGKSEDEIDRYLKEQEVKETLSEKRGEWEKVNGIFVCELESDTFLSVTDGKETYEKETAIKKKVHDFALERSARDESMGWSYVMVDDVFYLVRAVQFHSIILGVWMETEGMLLELYSDQMQEMGTICFIGEDNRILKSDWAKKILSTDKEDSQSFIQDGQDQYMVIYSPSSVGGIALAEFIKDKDVLKGLSGFWAIIIGSLTVLGCLILFYLIMIRKILVLPLKKVVTAMKELRKGNLEVRLEPEKSSSEMELVNVTFNEMARKIKDLKISIYEEKINRQKSELGFLQIQAKPHFFINSLNVIYSLAELKKYETIQEMVYCLSKYYQYTLQGKEGSTLQQELEHIDHYCKIQEIRFPNRIYIEKKIEEEALQCIVPQLVIQTFVENALKYAVTLEKELKIVIEAEYKKEAENQFLQIHIQDNGRGFSKEVLEGLKSEKIYEDERGKHIGIYNLKSRLSILYGNRQKMELTNAQEGGASIKMILPIE